MRPRARSWTAGRGDDAGSAVVEFTVLATVMLLPIVYLVVAIGRIEAGAFAAQRAAREAGRAFVAADDDEVGQAGALTAAAIAFHDQGFDDARSTAVRVTCDRSDCHVADTRVEVRTVVNVVLPGVPRLLDRVVPAHVEVSARHVATVDRFRAR